MKIFFSHGDGVEFPALLLQPLCAADLERRDPQETGREGKKNGTKGYMLLWIVGRDLSLSLSLFPLSFFHYSRNVHLFAGLVDVAFSFQRLYAPTMGRRTEVSIPSPSSIPFFPLFSTTGVHPTPPLTGKSFTRRSWNFLIVPASPLFHEARPRAARLSFELPETAPSNGAKHIFPSLLPVSIHCAPPPPTCFPVGVATREGFLPPRSQFTEELIPLRSDGEVGRKEAAVTARVAATE